MALLSAPERWYVVFWLTAGLVSLTPIYTLLWLILKK